MIRDDPPPPAGVEEPDPVVFVRVVLGPDGTIERPIAISGPERLLAPAEAVVRRWRAPGAPMMNAVPIVTTIGLLVVFR